LLEYEALKALYVASIQTEVLWQLHLKRERIAGGIFLLNLAKKIKKLFFIYTEAHQKSLVTLGYDNLVIVIWL